MSVRTAIYFSIICLPLCVGCQNKEGANPVTQNSLPNHSFSDSSAEEILLRASGACLAKITKLEEFDERPSDGDRYIKAWLEPLESSGNVPEYLYLVIQHGGHMPLEVLQELKQRELTLRHDSLKVGEQHWLIFSNDYDSGKFPHRVAAWWKHAEGTVPQDVIDAIRTDRFNNNPKWDKTLNVVYAASEEAENIEVLVREADSLAEQGTIFKRTIPGKLLSLTLDHWNGSYEAEWPEDEERHIAMLHTKGKLEEGNLFELKSDSYRINYAFDLATGKKFAQWVAADQEIWLMKSFQQYDLSTGEVTIDMDFELLATAGLEAGAETENWYRKTVRKYESGKIVHQAIYRHEHIKTGKERVYSGSGWILISESKSFD